MTIKALSHKYYELLTKLYRNINSQNIKWTKALNAEYFSAEINFRFKMRISRSVSNLAPDYVFRLYDDGGIKIMEISSAQNGEDLIATETGPMRVHDVLEEIYEWARAYSLDIIEKIERATELLDTFATGKKPK